VPGIINYTKYADQDDVRSLMSNGVLTSPDGAYLLVQKDYINEGQQQIEVHAPIIITVSFSIFSVNKDDTEIKEIGSFSANGAPAQAYNYAATQFAHRVSRLVDLKIE